VIRTHFGVRDNANITHVPFTLPSGTVVQLTLAETGEDSMTGSRVWQIRELVGDDDFLLTYGDGLSDVPIQQLIEFHNSHSAAMTLTAVRPPSRFGEVEVGTDGLATSFNEKPQVSAGLISGGFFVCRPTISDYLNPREDLVLEAEPMRRMTSDRRLAAYVHEGFWQCMDTYRDWLLLNELEATGEAPWRH
jgi:glucose-1-phosphate cytidylyltransferase